MGPRRSVNRASARCSETRRCPRYLALELTATPGRLAPVGHQRLLELCAAYKDCVRQTPSLPAKSVTRSFDCKERRRVLCKQLRSHNWHQLNFFITKRKDLGRVLLTRKYYRTKCDTDHSFLASNVRQAPKKIHHSKTKASVETRWSHFRDTI